MYLIYLQFFDIYKLFLNLPWKSEPHSKKWWFPLETHILESNVKLVATYSPTYAWKKQLNDMKCMEKTYPTKV